MTLTCICTGYELVRFIKQNPHVALSDENIKLGLLLALLIFVGIFYFILYNIQVYLILY